MSMRQPDAAPAMVPAANARPFQWLMLVHQLPAKPSNFRVRTWRRLQQLGAVAVKQAVNVLPDSPAAREDFEWLRAEIEASGGEATVFRADAVDSWANDELVEEFRRAREDDYRALDRDLSRLAKVVAKTARSERLSPQLLRKLRTRLAAIERIDFFSSAGRDSVLTKLQQLEAHSSGRSAREREPDSGAQITPRGALWVTRPRPGVDRMASAWLIRRFVDTEAHFDFVADRRSLRPDAIPFDMFNVEYGHHGDSCTFETLTQKFTLSDPAVLRVAALVHDVDLKDAKFGAVEASTVGALIEGLQMTHADDQRLLEEGMKLFETLYQSFSKAARVRGPRPVARRSSRRGV